VTTGKKFYNIDTRWQCYETFFLSHWYFLLNKLERLSLTSLFSQFKYLKVGPDTLCMGATTFSILTLSIMTLYIRPDSWHSSYIILSINATEHNDTVSSDTMLSVAFFARMNVIMLSVVMLYVVAPWEWALDNIKPSHKFMLNWWNQHVGLNWAHFKTISYDPYVLSCLMAWVGC
jgi:hypothetical protein